MKVHYEDQEIVTYKFRDQTSAGKYALMVKQKYGFKPTVYHYTKPQTMLTKGESFFAVTFAKTMTPIKRRR